MPIRRRIPVLESEGLTDIGLRRKGNDDFLLRSARKQLFIVADGVGGAEHGNVASREAAQKMHELFDPRLKNLGEAMSGAHEHVKLVNVTRQTAGSTILQRRKKEQYECATTLTALHIDRNGMAHIAQAGDSRAYLFRGNVLKQITKDQIDPVNPNGLGQYVGAGELTPVVTRGLTKPRDLFLLCTDGLTKHVRDELIHDVLHQCATEQLNLKEATRTLIKEAKNRGGSDNITAVIVRVK